MTQLRLVALLPPEVDPCEVFKVLVEMGVSSLSIVKDMNDLALMCTTRCQKPERADSKSTSKNGLAPAVRPGTNTPSTSTLNSPQPTLFLSQGNISATRVPICSSDTTVSAQLESPMETDVQEDCISTNDEQEACLERAPESKTKPPSSATSKSTAAELDSSLNHSDKPNESDNHCHERPASVLAELGSPISANLSDFWEEPPKPLQEEDLTDTTSVGVSSQLRIANNSTMLSNGSKRHQIMPRKRSLGHQKRATESAVPDSIQSISNSIQPEGVSVDASNLFSNSSFPSRRTTICSSEAVSNTVLYPPIRVARNRLVRSKSAQVADSSSDSHKLSVPPLPNAAQKFLSREVERTNSLTDKPKRDKYAHPLPKNGIWSQYQSRISESKNLAAALGIQQPENSINRNRPCTPSNFTVNQLIGAHSSSEALHNSLDEDRTLVDPIHTDNSDEVFELPQAPDQNVCSSPDKRSEEGRPKLSNFHAGPQNNKLCGEAVEKSRQIREISTQEDEEESLITEEITYTNWDEDEIQILEPANDLSRKPWELHEGNGAGPNATINQNGIAKVISGANQSKLDKSDVAATREYTGKRKRRESSSPDRSKFGSSDRGRTMTKKSKEITHSSFNDGELLFSRTASQNSIRNFPQGHNDSAWREALKTLHQPQTPPVYTDPCGESLADNSNFFGIKSGQKARSAQKKQKKNGRSMEESEQTTTKGFTRNLYNSVKRTFKRKPDVAETSHASEDWIGPQTRSRSRGRPSKDQTSDTTASPVQGQNKTRSRSGGRPRKDQISDTTASRVQEQTRSRSRGRPRKDQTSETTASPVQEQARSKSRGRPTKKESIETSTPVAVQDNVKVGHREKSASPARDTVKERIAHRRNMPRDKSTVSLSPIRKDKVQSRSHDIICAGCRWSIAVFKNESANDINRKLLNHLSRYHETPAAYGCSMCDYHASSTKQMEEHITKTHGGTATRLEKRTAPSFELTWREQCELCFPERAEGLYETVISTFKMSVINNK